MRGKWMLSAVVTLAVVWFSVAFRAQVGSVPDFDAAMKSVRFDPATTDGNGDGQSRGNGIPDAQEFALLATILSQPSLDLRAHGGVDHASVREAFDRARAAAARDLAPLLVSWPSAADLAAAYAMLGRQSFDTYSAMCASFGTPLKSNYDPALQQERYLAATGDADGDGIANAVEYAVFGPGGRNSYLRAALDPSVRPSTGQLTTLPQKAIGASSRIVGIVLYPGFEVLDVFGPLEMWSYVPEFKVVTIAQEAGPVRSAQGAVTHADYSFQTAPTLNILMIPGGAVTRAQLQNPTLLDFLRTQNAGTEITSSVCTGSALLARAGLLKGRKATSNKSAFSLAVEQDSGVEWIGTARWVEDGKFMTSSGVSAGTDMALGLVAKLYGLDRARSLARSLEYEWHEDSRRDPFALTGRRQ